FGAPPVGRQERSRDSPALSPDQIDVARIDEQAGALAHDENGIASLNSIDQQHGSSGEAEIPEGDGDDAAFGRFAGDPLPEEAKEEERLADEADDDPIIEMHRLILVPPTRLAGATGASATRLRTDLRSR